MICPYCSRTVHGWTGLQEAEKFEKHLRKCRKNPNNIVISDGKKTAVTPIKHQGLMEALTIRSESDQ